MSLLDPTFRALRQLDDPALLRVVLLSVVAAIVGFALVGVAGWSGAHLLLGWANWLSGLVGTLGAALLAHYLFLPVAGGVASLMSDTIAAAVERRSYPSSGPARPAPLLDQIADGVWLGLKVLLLQVLALLLTPVLPGVSVLLAYGAAAWAIGRGLFVAVAMRHMDRRRAIALYGTRRTEVLLQGALAVAASLVPLLNLLVPVLAVVAMVHVLHQPGGDQAGLARPRPV